MFTAKVFVTLKKGVLDPQGQAVTRSLHTLGFEEAENVRIGKYIVLQIDTNDKEEADERIKEMCEKLLANTVIEEYDYNIEKE